jgi:enoyl-CoA hydratase/carnithine racemase
MAEELAGGKLLLDYPAEAVARLTVNRLESRNALDHELLDGIAAAMPSLDRGIEIRCVILTGVGGIFSAGYDIGGFSDDSFESDAESLVAHPFARGLDAVEAHPWPVLCAINGHALGGALELTLCCDLRICARGAKLGMPPAKLGLIYGHTGLQRFIDAVGVPRTKELFLTGRNLTADRAEEIGLVGEVVDDAELEGAAVELAAEVAGNAPLSMRGNKHAIDTLTSFARLTPEQERELIELRESCFTSEDFREGVAAFAEKRKPVWKGR